MSSLHPSFLDVLTEFVDEYDQGRKVRWRKISGLGSRKYLLEEHGMSAADLSRIIEQVALGYTCLYPKDPEKGLRWSVEL